MIGEDVRKTRMLGEKGYGCYINTENTGAIDASPLVLNKRCYTVSHGAFTINFGKTYSSLTKKGIIELLESREYIKEKGW